MYPSILVLLACSSSLTPGAPTEGDAPLGAGPGPAELTFTDPTAGSYVSVGQQPVLGIARHLSEVTVNDHSAVLQNGMFLLDLPTVLGLNTFAATGVAEADGALFADTASVLAGDFKEAEGVIADAVQLHVSASALAGLGPMLGDLFDPDTINTELQAMNPVVDTPEAEMTLGLLTFDPPVITLVPRAGVLEAQILLPNFNLPIDTRIRDALPFGIDLEIGVDIECDQVLLLVPIRLGTTPNGELDVHVGTMSAELSEFDLDTGILELIDWMFVDDDDLADSIEDMLAQMGPSVDDMVQDLVGGLDLELELELMEKVATLKPRFDEARVTPDGVVMSLGLAIDVDGAVADGPGHLTLPPPPPTQGTDVHVQVADDFMNRFLYELWAGGALDLNDPLGPEDAAILLLFGGSGSGNLSMKSALPPVWLERDGESRLQLGEIALTVETPGGQYGEVVEVLMALDARAEFQVGGDTAGVVLTDGQVKMRLAGASVGNAVLAEKLPGLETAFGIGIGVINEQLTFPLTDVLPEGALLPPIVLNRDPSTLGSVIDLTADDLTALLPLLTGEVPPPPPPPLPPNDVPVPANATVLDQDEARTADNEVGWICEQDDLETSGNGGTWYVSEDASLVITGTGHVVYAADNADIRLDSPGNTVYADPGANVDDNDGTNTVIELDPLTLDLTTAPTPGC
jgi:hypothetical protein